LAQLGPGGGTDAAGPPGRDRLLQAIAEAIREADKDYLRSSYQKIGMAVLAALQERGYVVAPKRPTTRMLSEAHARLNCGLQEAGGAYTALYEAMLTAWIDELESMRRLETLRRMSLGAPRTRKA
jgi:hypothetical protein